MLHQIRLEEIASVNYHFCKQYETEMKDYAGFKEEMKRVQKFKN